MRWRAMVGDSRHIGSERMSVRWSTTHRLSERTPSPIAVGASDMPAHGLRAGDIGTVVLVHQGGNGYTVECMTFNGDTVAVGTVPAEQIRTIFDFTTLDDVISWLDAHTPSAAADH